MSSQSLSLRGYPTKDNSFLLFVNYSVVDSVGPTHTPPIRTYRTLSVDLPHIRHMTFAVTLSFPVFLWWYNLIGNICWYNSCIAATVWVGTGLQLFIHAKHPPLSRAESSHLFLVSCPCHFSSPSVTQ